MKALKHLEELLLQDSKNKYPNLPDHCRVVNTFKTAKAEKREKKRIETFLQLMPKCTGNINENAGTRIDNTKIIDNGITAKTIGSVEWRYSGVRKGIEDVSAVIMGKMVAIEVKRVYKNGKDRQSIHQVQRQKEVENAGGIYIIVTGFEDFYNQFWNLYK